MKVLVTCNQLFLFDVLIMKCFNHRWRRWFFPY